MATTHDSQARRFLAALQGVALALLALHLLAGFLPEEKAWGLWPYSTLPPLAQVGGVVLAGLLLWPPVHRRVESAWRRVSSRPVVAAILQWRARVGKGWTYALLAGLAAFPLWWGRLVHTRWGDTYILTQAIPHPQVRLTYTWQAPLDLFLHAKLWGWANHWWGWDVMRLYNATSVAAGVVFIFLLCWVADDLARSELEALFLGGAVASLGMMQLFFGYAENYTLIPLGILGFLWLGVRFLKGRASLGTVGLVLALTNAFHPSTLVLWPSALLLPLLRDRRPGHLLRQWAKLALPALLVGVGVVALMESGGHGLEALFGADFPGGGDRRWWVPLWRTETRWEHYTMFSVGHLLDVVNEQVLVAPFTLPVLALAYGVLRPPAEAPNLPERFLAAAGVSYLALTLLWNPDYGGRRDWDLFAPAALPLTVWMAYVIPRRLGSAEALRQAAWAVIPTSLIHLAGWVYSNTLPWSW